MTDLPRFWSGVLIAAACGALAACSALSGGSSAPSPVTLTTGPAAPQSAAAQAGTEPGILAVTKAGALNLLDVVTAKYYAPSAGTSMFVASTEKSGQANYLREGVYLRSGGLFLSQACCEGLGQTGGRSANGARLLLEAGPDGTVTKQVATGFANLTHDSLAVSPDGGWLLYVGGTSLYVSKGGARPKQLSSGDFPAAAWA